MLPWFTLIKIFLLLVINRKLVTCTRDKYYKTYSGDLFKAEPGQFPWNVWIETHLSDGSNNSWCSGTIISNYWIVTSADCLKSAAVANIYPGIVNTSHYDLTIKSYEFTFHEKSVDLDYDIALMKLISPICFNDLVNSIKLSNRTIEAYDVITLPRWQTNDKYLRYSHYAVLRNDDCEVYYKENFKTETDFCTTAGPDNSGCTIGFTGSGAVTYHRTKPTLAGIFIYHSSPCDTGGPIGFLHIAKFREWIKQHSGV